jgi:hypothetical protein
MVVRFNYPAGVSGWEEDIDINKLEVLPRVGETIDKDGDEYFVKHVVHYLFEEPPMIYIVLRRP